MVTSEYGMLPGSTRIRKVRESSEAGRREARNPAADRPLFTCVTDTDLLGERTIWIDCDVIQADEVQDCSITSSGYIALGSA